MTNAARKRARLMERGLVRFEVLGRDCDRAPIRSVARRLSEEGPGAVQLRESVSQILDEKAMFSPRFVARRSWVSISI